MRQYENCRNEEGESRGGREFRGQSVSSLLKFVPNHHMSRAVCQTKMHIVAVNS